MFENMSEQQAREKILELTAQYYQKYHAKRRISKKGIEYHMRQECMMLKKW